MYEERLLASVRQVLGAQVDTLRSAPIVPRIRACLPTPSRKLLTSAFPWPRFLGGWSAPDAVAWPRLSSQQFRLKPDVYRPDRVQYVHEICQRPGQAPTVVPARFVVACKFGHLDDFPWVEFVHRGPTQCKYKLKFIELGASGEAAELEVRCEACDASRRMADAFGIGVTDLPNCRGRRPHLRDFEENGCKTPDGQSVPMKAMLQGASDSVVRRHAFGPGPAEIARQTHPTGQRQLDGPLRHRKRSRDHETAEKESPARLFRVFRGRAIAGDPSEAESGRDGGGGEEATELKPPEWQIFSNPNSVAASKDFKLRIVNPPSRYAKYIEKVVLAERLREVRALVGFTRIESPGDYDSSR